MNYSNVLEKKLEDIISCEKVPTLLLHSCCAPCSSYVISYLIKYFNITILYYNPNISPREEYERRKIEQIRLINEFDFDNELTIMDCDYDNDVFEEMIKGLEKEKEGGIRCHKCYRLRLEKTAMLAKEGGFDYFCSTLSVSPYKNSKVLNEIGSVLEDMYDVKWLYSDFKKKDGYKKSIELSKKYNLYRQDYCGCIYSKINK